MSESNERLLLDRIRKEMDAVVEEALERIREDEELLKGMPDRVRKKLRGILESYRDLERTIRTLGTISILDVRSETAKVGTLNDHETNTLTNYSGSGFSVNASPVNLFSDHPTGCYFKLEPGKKYRLLVAFIPLEEEEARKG